MAPRRLCRGRLVAGAPARAPDGLVAGSLPVPGIADLPALLDKNLVAASFQKLLTTGLYDAIAATSGPKGGFAPRCYPAASAADLQRLMQHPNVALLLSYLSGLDTLGQTSAVLHAGTTTLITQAGLPEALNSGAIFTVASPDGIATAVLCVAQAVASQATMMPVQAYAGTVALPAGSTVQLGSPLLPDYLGQWLAQAALLYGVPFNNLVADSRMLPPESRRFFYLDTNWMAALPGGAPSIGLQSSRDTVFQQLMRAKLHQAVGTVVPEVRGGPARQAGGRCAARQHTARGPAAALGDGGSLAGPRSAGLRQLAATGPAAARPGGPRRAADYFSAAASPLRPARLRTPCCARW